MRIIVLNECLRPILLYTVCLTSLYVYVLPVSLFIVCFLRFGIVCGLLSIDTRPILEKLFYKCFTIDRIITSGIVDSLQ